MFEDVCLTCGKHMASNDTLYCSHRCESGGLVSPAISSASSALSSPYLGHNDTTSDVPVLALGSALAHAYASSASSTCWSATDDEDAEDSSGYTSDNRQHDDSIIEPMTKPIRYMPPRTRPSAMSFARRPSGVNNPGKSLNPLERSSIRPSSDMPKSAPIQSYFHRSSRTSEDDNFSDVSKDESDYTSPNSSKLKEKKRISNATKTKRTKNRTSLPPYFSLLQLESKNPESKSSSSSTTLSRPSPPAHRVGNPTTSVHALTALPSSLSAVSPTRGRRKVVDHSDRTVSSSSERSRTNPPAYRCSHTETSAEQVFGWPPAMDPRDGPTQRRNSSPPQKLLDTARVFLQQFGHCGPTKGADAARGGDARERRGRYRAAEFQLPTSCDAPGLGLGRSGLVGRHGVTNLP